MYTKEQVDEVLSQVEQEFEKAMGSIEKNEEELNSEEVETAVAQETEDLQKSEVEESEAQEEDYETIDDLYASMTKGEKEAHYASIKKALYGEEETPVVEEPIAKSEEAEEVSEEKEEVLAKSENDELKSENEELKKNLDQVNELLSKMFDFGKKAPEQKAITATNYIAKSEDTKENDEIDLSKMSKSEITSKLNGVNFSELSKSDREAINDFYLENGSVDKIKHLIKE
jgi:hypothetical protein